MISKIYRSIFIDNDYEYEINIGKKFIISNLIVLKENLLEAIGAVYSNMNYDE